MALVVKITPNEKGNPPGKLADAELHFIDGELDGLRLIGFSIWERRGGGGRNVTFPARQCMDVATAIKIYAEERRAQVSKRMAAYWLENAKPLAAFFEEAKLRQITPTQLAAYQNARTDQGRVPKTINGELSVLRQVLKRARLWYRFVDDYVTLRNQKPPVGTALTSDEQQRLFEMAQTRPSWLYAYIATTLSFYCGLRACEIKALRWRDVDLDNALLHVRRSKTPAGWRAPTLNATCIRVVRYLHDQAATLRFTEPDHFVFPWHGRTKRLDPTRGMTSWRTAWRNIRKELGSGTCASMMAATRRSLRWPKRDYRIG